MRLMNSQWFENLFIYSQVILEIFKVYVSVQLSLQADTIK